MPVQNKAIPDDNGIQQPPFVENVLLKLLFFFKIQGRDLALKFRVDFKRILTYSLELCSSTLVLYGRGISPLILRLKFSVIFSYC